MKLSRQKIQRMVDANQLNVSKKASGGGGVGGSGGASETWVKENFVSIDFFGRLFKTYDSAATPNEVKPNDLESTITNIKAMFGFWTDQYLSALGLDPNSGGGGGGTGDVTWDALASNSDVHPIAISHLTGALADYAKLRQANDFVYNYNEVTFVPANYNNYLWLNYRAGSGTGNISAYYMGNGGGSGGFASVVAASFVKNGGTSAQFLKADGSVDSNSYLTSVAFSNLTSHPTTLAGYGITDAKISNGTITLGSNSITPLTSESYTGTVTSVATGTGLTGGTITSSGTISIDSTYQTYISHGESAYNSLSNYLPLSGGTITGALGKSSNYLIKPVADYRTSSKTRTGCIAITLPATIGDTMVSMWIDVYNYSTNTSFSVHCGGYAYENSTWGYNPFALVFGASHRVRFGHNGTSFVVYIGETDSTWSYPQITVRDVVLGYSPTYANWYKDWTISFVTSVSNVTADITRYAITSGNLIDSIGTSYVKTYLGVDVDPSTTYGYWAVMTTQSGITSDWWHILHMDWSNGANWRSELALPTQNRKGVYYRSDGNNWAWNAWIKLLDEDNYSSYALPLTGGTITGIITVDRGSNEIFQTKSGKLQLHISDSFTILGYSNPIAGINTYIDGRNIVFRCSTNHTTGMYINSSANVGIGTTSPVEKLDVNGNILSNNIRIWGNQVTNDSKGLFIQASDKTNRAYITWNGNVAITDYLNIASVYGNIILSPSQYVGIGTKSPSCKLEVAGTIKAATTGATATLTYTSLSLGSSGAGAITLSLENTNKLKITADTTYTTGGFYSNSYVSALGQNTSSDARKKNVMGNVELDINDIAAAPSVKYLWKDRDLGLQAGSIAQYWQNVLPECVHTDMDGYLNMEYGVIALLASIATANEVKNLRKRVSELEKEVKQLKAA